jgi:hypothetical protein
MEKRICDLEYALNSINNNNNVANNVNNNNKVKSICNFYRIQRKDK